MQIFNCPFCGPRGEVEFHFLGEFGKLRPETTHGVSPEEWASYLYVQRNDKGNVQEVWMHKPCAEVFKMERNSVSMAVTGSTAFRGEGT